MLAHEVADYMDAQGSWTLDTDLFYHDWPDSDVGTYDTATVVRPYAGAPPDHAFDGPATERAGIQVMCRSRTPSVAEANIEAAFALLDGVSATMGDESVLQMRANQSPFYLGRDDAERYLFAVNFSTVTSR